jgi:hypothetical protein
MMSDYSWNAKVPFIEVNICLLDYDVGVSSANTLDFGQRKHDLVLSIDIGVEKTEDVLERILVRDN